MMSRSIALALLAVGSAAVLPAKEEMVATAVYGRVGNGYKRDKTKDGKFKPEYYALSNGGRVAGTTSDSTIDRVTYQEVADIAMKLLSGQNYHYAKSAEQAKLLLVLQWGATLAPDNSHKDRNVAALQAGKTELASNMESAVDKLKSSGFTDDQAREIVKNTLGGTGRSLYEATNEEIAIAASAGAIESNMLRTMVDNRVRDELNHRNAQVLGYMDDLADSNDIRRYAGGGDRYADLITEVEEGRYYIVVSAYDFPELVKTQKKKLLWQTRVSVRSPGNAFDKSVAAMLKSASPYFGRNSGKLVRGEETLGSVEMSDLKFLGEAKDQPKEGKK
jgi:hypothetical protein